MTQQTHGTPELKYSEETFRDMYEALKKMLANMNWETRETFNDCGFGTHDEEWGKIHKPKLENLYKALSKAEGREQ